ncbi:RUN and FYVE domain-containing protein 1 [Nasonia vitripennis]|uniref:Uncharacterized protein n=1 Tax=Nasonia vitripennis TaxID=7425 RepID=A0A7M7GGS5_NASVI|nr:RUN and FYVE domain-containing protein 1 [Nasonia vitripennis]XP_031778219.1 RUN and FYVE domain-containing protein 1 [Nasonia vitripennis]
MLPISLKSDFTAAAVLSEEEIRLENQELRLILAALREDVSSLQTALAEERRKRQALEVRHQRLALGLYRVTAAQEKGAAALKRVLDGQGDKVKQVCEEVERWKPVLRNGKLRLRCMSVQQ